MDISVCGHCQRSHCDIGAESDRRFFSLVTITYRYRRLYIRFLLPVAHAQNHPGWRGLCHLVWRRRCADRCRRGRPQRIFQVDIPLMDA